MRRGWAAGLLAVALLAATPVAAEPVKVRLKEGNSRGFLALRPPGGDPIAYGELGQRPSGTLIANRLLLNFKDGSVYDETVTFSQDGLFRLEAYRLTQRGPSFPLTEVAFDRRSGRYTARTQDGKEGKVETASGELEMPADLYNGMALTLLKNLPARATATAHMVAFMPKPRLIKMGLAQEGTDSARVGGATRKANRYLVKLEVGGLTGVVASLVGKEPPAHDDVLFGDVVPSGHARGGRPAVLILTICHGGCEGGWANAKIVSRFCQEGKTRKTVIDRSRSKKRPRAPVLLMACSQRS